jgi:hypothetical protein
MPSLVIFLLRCGAVLLYRDPIRTQSHDALKLSLHAIKSAKTMVYQALLDGSPKSLALINSTCHV